MEEHLANFLKRGFWCLETVTTKEMSLLRIHSSMFQNVPDPYKRPPVACSSRISDGVGRTIKLEGQLGQQWDSKDRLDKRLGPAKNNTCSHDVVCASAFAAVAAAAALPWLLLPLLLLPLHALDALLMLPRMLVVAHVVIHYTDNGCAFPPYYAHFSAYD